MGETHHRTLEDLSYEQARDELIGVVQRLESPGVPLADSMALWKRAQLLADHCEQFLAAAEQTLTAETSTANPAEPEQFPTP